MADRILRLGCALIISIAIARTLGPAEFGTLQYVLSFVGMFGMMLSLGLDPVVLRELVIRPNNAGALLGTVMTMRMLAACGGIITMLISSHLMGHSDVALLMIIILSTTLLLQVPQIIEQYFHAQTAAVTSSIIYTFSALSGAAWVAYCLYSRAPIIFFSMQLVLETTLIATGLFLAFRRFTVGQFKIHFDRKLLAPLINECWPLTLSLAMIGIHSNIDKILVRQLLGDESIGIYAAAAKLSEAWYFVPMVITNSLFPAIVRARESSPERYKQRLQDLYNLMVWLGIAIALPVSFASEWIVTSLYGESYRSAGDVLKWHVWSSIPVFLGVASGRWLILEGHMKAYMWRTLAGVISHIVFIMLLIPEVGIIGAAWATLLSQLIVVFAFDFAWKISRENFRMKCRALISPYKNMLNYRKKHE